MRLDARTLEGGFVRLEPYGDASRGALRVALDADEPAWSLNSRPAFGEHFDAWWRAAQAKAVAGSWINFVVRRRADHAVVGTTSFIDINSEAASVEVGATFLSPCARGGAVNPDVKRLMLEAAFAAGARRVQIVTDLRNLRSQAAIAKLGAQREGVLRRHKQTWTGHVRDTVVFSIVDAEWPDVRRRLDARLQAFAAAAPTDQRA